MNLIKLKYFYVFCLSMLLSGCWYRQCAIKACMVRHDHQHGGKIVRGRGTFPTPHFFGMHKTVQEKQDASDSKRRKKKR